MQTKQRKLTERLGRRIATTEAAAHAGYTLKKGVTHGMAADQSPAVNDPWRHLAAAILLKAVKDYRRRSNPRAALDASVFLIVAGAEYAQAAGFDLTPEGWEVLIAKI
jgi:hypothetical protein